MVNVTESRLYATRGRSNSIYGTDRNDSITINGNMHAYERGANNLIHLYDGADNVWIGHKMWAWGGRNTILGDDGQKNLTVKYGMYASHGGTNEIALADTIPYFTTYHNLTIGHVWADHRGQNLISTGTGDDRIAFTSHFSAHQDGQNVITVCDGSKNLSFAYGIDSSHGGKNIIDMGVGNQTVTFGGNVHAGYGGTNQIISKGGNVSVHIKHNLDAIGVNDIYLGEGKGKIVIDGNMFSHAKGSNRIVSEAETAVLIKGFMTSYGLNQIETGKYDDQITINKGLYAFGGTNQIDTGDGHDRVTIKGHIAAGVYNTNIIHTGEGNDVISLDAYVAPKSLVIDAGEGYDVLALNAANVHTFKSQYWGWLSNAHGTAALTGSGLEEIQANITRGIDLGQIDWLTQIVNQHNIGYGDDIAISLALDNGGARINLGDIFTSRDESSITILDLTGGNRNDLRINDTLASNGYDADGLRIDGDSNDRVSFDQGWSAAGATLHENENYYHIWNNMYGETVLVQDGVDIYVY